MVPLLILGLLLLALWLFGIWEQDRRARFMRNWRHLPLVTAVIVLLMALGTALRG